MSELEQKEHRELIVSDDCFALIQKMSELIHQHIRDMKLRIRIFWLMLKR